MTEGWSEHPDPSIDLSDIDDAERLRIAAFVDYHGLDALFELVAREEASDAESSPIAIRWRFLTRAAAGGGG